MPTNSNYLSVVQGFQEGVAYYEAATPGMFGAADFSASALFVKRGLFDGQQAEVLFSNVDGNGNGWYIQLNNDTTLEVSMTDSIGPKVVDFDLSLSVPPATIPYVGKMILVTLVVETDNNRLTLYVNGTRLGGVAMVGGVVPATGSKATVGVLATTHVDPASTCLIAGVGYKAGLVAPGSVISMFCAACDAVDIEGGGAIANGELFTNRWTAKDLNQGTTDPTPIWVPRIGGPNLLRVGDLFTASYKNLTWY
jgi:hypothetical protein